MPYNGKVFEFDTLYESNFGGEAKKFGNIYIYQIGEISCMSGYTFPLHEQWCHEISYVISGEGIFTTDNDTDLLVAGDIHFCPNKSKHAISVSGDKDLRYAYLGFTFANEENQSEEIKQIEEFFENVKKYKAKGNSKIERIFFRCLDEFYGQGVFSNTMISTYLLQLLVLSFRSFDEQPYFEYFPAIKITGSKRSVFLATQYIDSHIFENISASEVAKNIGYNFSYLSNVFKVATKLTISQYISKMKMQKAIEFMQNGKFSMAEISEKLNFSSLQSFNRAFKRNIGCPPAQFVKNNFNAEYKP